MQNSVNMTGRLTRDPELKEFEGGNRVANFSLAVGRNYKNKDGEYEADFFNCQARNGTADLICKYFKKGDMCPVTGELRTRKYDKDGTAMTYTYVDVNNITFVGGASSADNAAQKDTEPSFDDFTPYAGNEDDLPF